MARCTKRLIFPSPLDMVERLKMRKIPGPDRTSNAALRAVPPMTIYKIANNIVRPSGLSFREEKSASCDNS